MPWNLPTRAVETFGRNTLAAVIAQVRFEPILRVTTSVTDFQESVRGRFPGFEQAEAQTFNIDGASAQMRMTSEIQSRFHARTEPTVAVLSRDSVTLEYTRHRQRSVLTDDMGLLIGALKRHYSPVTPTRLGLRYVNIIDREDIAAELGRDVPWDELIAGTFSAVPAGLADLEDTSFIAEVTSSLPIGRMTVRYGLRLEPVPGRPCFRLDTDRYLDGTFQLDDLAGTLDTFSSDIFQVFMTAAGPALLEWMSQKGAR